MKSHHEGKLSHPLDAVSLPRLKDAEAALLNRLLGIHGSSDAEAQVVAGLVHDEVAAIGRAPLFHGMAVV
jgi:hypothetical protein